MMRFWDNLPVEMDILGQRIRLARERLGMPQEELAAAIGKDQRAVSEYEHGKRRIAAVDLPRFAEVLQVPLLYFYEGELRPDDLDSALLYQFHRLSTAAARQKAIELLRVFTEALEEQA